MNTEPLKLTFCAGALACLVATASFASTIYRDDFARIGSLSGSAPTVDNTGNSVTWVASAGYVCTGTNGLINNGINGDWQGGALLPLDWTGAFPDPKVELDMKVASGGGNWLALNLGDCNYWGNPASTAMFKLYGDGHVEVCHGPGWDGAFVITNIPAAGNAGGWNHLLIEYSNSIGVANFYVNGSPMAENVPITSKTTGVGLNSNSGGESYFTNLLVTSGIEILVAPSIITQPQSQTVFVGDNIHLAVTASGSLPFQYTWRKNGVDIPGPNSGIFVISNAAVGDTANYSVVLANSAGSVTSAVARAEAHLEAQTTLAQDNFDTPVGTAYDFSFTYSSDSTLILPSTRGTLADAGVGGSSAFAITADGSDFANGSVTYSGFGGGWAQDFLPLATHNLGFYIWTGIIRVENLQDGKTNTPGRVDLRFFAPDGTTGPANGAQDLVFGCENHYSFTSNFHTFTFVLNASDFGGDTGQAAFSQYQSAINRVQFEFTSDNFYTDFNNGPGDAMYIDDVKFIYRQSPGMTVTKSGPQAVLQWADPNVKLMGASSITGPYTVIPGVSSPYSVPGNSPYQFFRTAFQAMP